MTVGKGIFFKKGTTRNLEIYTGVHWAGSLLIEGPTQGTVTMCGQPCHMEKYKATYSHQE